MLNLLPGKSLTQLTSGREWVVGKMGGGDYLSYERSLGDGMFNYS